MDTDTLYLPNSLRALDTSTFAATLKQEIAALPFDSLPLQQCLRQSSAISNEPLTIMILGHRDNQHERIIRLGVSFSGIIAGCSCADDPTPIDTITEYCEFTLMFDRVSGAATITPDSG